MKKIVLISLLLALLIAGCNPKEAKTTYYKNQNSSKIMSRNELNKLKAFLEKRFENMGRFVQVHEVIIDSTVSHDSIIKTFKIAVTLSDNKVNPPKGKVFSYLNKRLPPFTSLSLNNKKINLSKLNGKPTLLNFWFTTCQPCIDEMPALNRIMNKYKGKVNFISITFNSRKSVEAFLRTHPFNFEKIAGAKEFINKLGIKYFPKNIFIDRNGIVRRIEGGVPEINKNGKLMPGNGKEFEKYVKELL